MPDQPERTTSSSAACGAQISMAAWGEPDEILTCTLPPHDDDQHRDGDFAQWRGDDPNTVAIGMAGGPSHA